MSLQKSVITDFCRQKVGRSRFRVRHDAGVFRPNRRHQRNANGEKTLKPVSFGLSGQKLKIFVGKKLNQRPAKCAILELRMQSPISAPLGWLIAELVFWLGKVFRRSRDWMRLYSLSMDCRPSCVHASQRPTQLIPRRLYSATSAGASSARRAGTSCLLWHAVELEAAAAIRHRRQEPGATQAGIWQEDSSYLLLVVWNNQNLKSICTKAATTKQKQSPSRERSCSPMCKSQSPSSANFTARQLLSSIALLGSPAAVRPVRRACLL